jgi:secondary thiamine-phosphate synthase enzyme
MEIRSTERTQFIDITDEVQRNVGEGRGVLISSPHTTCGITLNEGTDRDVAQDMDKKLRSLIPEQEGYAHAEGNSDAHIKTSIIGSSVMLPLEGGRIRLGRWQRVFLAEFDGPRSRTVDVTVF